MTQRNYLIEMVALLILVLLVAGAVLFSLQTSDRADTGPTTPNAEAVQETPIQPTESIMLDDPPPMTATPNQGAVGSLATLESGQVQVLTDPVQVASARVLIRDDVSGAVIGDGTFRLFAPRRANTGETVLVELELEVDNLYVTPTPSNRQVTPPPRITSTPVGERTPRAAVYSESGLEIYQRMGATLTCSARSFTGCDDQRSLGDAKIINGTLTTWSWFLDPQAAVTGTQNLRVDVWTSERNLDGSLEFIDQWDHTLSINLNTAADGESFDWLPVVLAAGVLLLISGVGFAVWRIRLSTPPDAIVTAPTRQPKVFISYRRRVSWALARSVANSLQERGADVFIDIDDINEGRFADIIETSIEDADYFVPILAPTTLDSKWVRREIAHALTHDINIVPLLVEDFRFDPTALSDDIQGLASHNAITVLPEFYEEAVNRLATRFLKLK